MTNKKLISILKAKIKRVGKQISDLDAINTDSIKKKESRYVVKNAKCNSLLLAYGRLNAYREIFRELKYNK